MVDSIQARVRQALSRVMDPELHRSIVEMGMVQDLAVADGRVTFTLALTTMGCPLKGRIQDDARRAAMPLAAARAAVRVVMYGMRYLIASLRM